VVLSLFIPAVLLTWFCFVHLVAAARLGVAGVAGVVGMLTVEGGQVSVFGVQLELVCGAQLQRQ
jgi:hypothetical protein